MIRGELNGSPLYFLDFRIEKEMALATNLQDTILQAVDTIVANRVSQLATDKTVTATIAGCTNALTREYLVSYNGGSMKAYAQEGATYTTSQTVYVLVPEGDFTNQKTIISVAQATEDDSNISFVSSALSNYNLLGGNCWSDRYKLIPNAGLGVRSYKKEDCKVLYQRDPDPEIYGENPTFLSLDITELENSIRDAEALLLEASFRTGLPRAHKMSQSGIYGLTCTLAFNDADSTDEDGNPTVKLLNYTIDSNGMTGSPFQFTSWFDQYQIFPIDVDNFLYVENVRFWCSDFVEETDPLMSLDRDAGGYGDDIFIKNLEMYGLKKISAASGTYRLNLSMPKGATFYTTNDTESLSVVGKVVNGSTNISDAAMFYWFKQDGRVTSSSSDYQMYGGSGWSYLKAKGNVYNFSALGIDNKAYENRYMCCAVYKEQVVLKDYFTFYNESCKRDIAISSSLGTSFSFDRGVPRLTCLINGKDSNFESDETNPHKDDFFRFVWSKEDEYGQVTTFSQTKEELEAEYKKLIKEGTSYNVLSPLKSKINELEGVAWDKNTLDYPVKAIDSSATFKCAVYLRDREPVDDEEITDIEYLIGSPSITLKNAQTADPTDYYITIENGDQVFQYSESGVSPDDERYTDPLEVKNLICHFYDPAGLEVNNKTYTVKWVVPIENTLIITPSQGMRINPANGKIEWCDLEEFPLSIKGDYDYSALNNQVRAIVTYDGVEYHHDSDLLFTKIGENGTNGTDIVAKISPTATNLDDDLLALVIESGEAKGFNSGQKITDKVLQFNLYQRNAKLELDSTIYWKMSGGTGSNSKYMSCSNGVITWSNDAATNRKFRNQIVSANVKWTVGKTDTSNGTSYDYYGYYPMPVISYLYGKLYDIGIDKTKTLKSVTYNSDGRNPLYNKNQGVFINFNEASDEFDPTVKYYVWTAEGGEPTKSGTVYQDNPANAAFKLIQEQDSADGATRIAGAGITNIYILPNDVYDGEYSNNVVRCRIYANESAVNPEVEIYVPIYMSLNTYGLKSLNSWDGNHVEINEDENYILAPQIGAGEKDDENKFTGIVMGTSKTYDSDESTIGLLGYSHGKQSILLDAEDGSATFGLPEDQASAGNCYTEGRIELVPGGESKIGMWRIGSRALYNIASGDASQPAEPDAAYKDYPVDGAQFAVGHEDQGMILNADPAYLSVKGMPLTDKNSSIVWDGANTTLKMGDSLEVEVDPRKSSVFSIYRHTLYNGATRTDTWRRYPLVGINQNGQFYTNAVEDGESSMGIGKVGAFHNSAADQRYIGAQFGWKGTNLFKFFVDSEDSSTDAAKKLYISAGTTVDTYNVDGSLKSTGNEYPRAIGVYGKDITLYAKPDSSSAASSDSSEHKLMISQSEAYIGHKDNYLNIVNANSGTSKISLNNHFNFYNPDDRNTTWQTGYMGLNIARNLDVTAKTDSSVRINGGNLTISTSKDYKMTSQLFKSQTSASGKTWFFGDNSSTTYLTLNANSGKNTELKGNGLSLVGANAGVTITSSNSANGIKMSARVGSNDGGGTSLSLIPQTGGAGMFSISSGMGSIMSNYSNIPNVGTRYHVDITPGVVSPWCAFTGNIPNTAISVMVSRDVKSVGGWMYAGDFAFNSSKSWSSYGSQAQLSSHLSQIYAELRSLRDVTNSHTQTLNNYNTRINTAQQTANSAQQTANSANSNANNRVDWSTYNKHTHQTNTDGFINIFDWDTYDSVVGKVSHIKNVKFNKAITSIGSVK